MATGGMARETDSLMPTVVSEDDPQSRQHDPVHSWRKKSTIQVSASVAAILFILAFAALYCESSVSDGNKVEASFFHDTLPLLGSSKKKKSKDTATCADGKYSKRTLKLAYELPFASLFRDNKGQRKYEASSVIVVDDSVYAVCDSSWAISKFDAQLQPFAENNIQVGDPTREKEDSGYEALFHDDGTFYVMRESVDHGSSKDKEVTGYHAIIEELDLEDDDYSVVEQCPTEFEFEGTSKGFEGVIAVDDLDGELVVLGLCEGNHCSQTLKNDSGHGVLVAMRKTFDKHGHCQWETIRKIEVPKSAYFRDYSAITLREGSSRVAISSQEESQMWVGTLLGRNDAGLWDVDNMKFDSDDGTVYDFPKNDDCQTIYCNIEGIHFINDDTVIAVSDKMKSRGKQDFRCFDKDQSVHVFVLP